MALKQNPLLPVHAWCLYMRLWSCVDSIGLIPGSFRGERARETPQELICHSQIRDMVSNITIEDRQQSEGLNHWSDVEKKNIENERCKTERKKDKDENEYSQSLLSCSTMS